MHYTEMEKEQYYSLKTRIDEIVARAEELFADEHARSPDTALHAYATDLLSGELQSELHELKLAMQSNRYQVWMVSPEGARERLKMRISLRNSKVRSEL